MERREDALFVLEEELEELFDTDSVMHFNSRSIAFDSLCGWLAMAFSRSDMVLIGRPLT